MPFTNYGELKTSVEAWTHRSDLTALIPDFIRLAQARINREVKHRFMVKRYDQTVSGDTRYVTVPTLAREILDVQVEVSGGRKPVLPMSTTQMNTYHSTVQVGTPTGNYALRGNTMEFQFTLADGTTVEMLTLDRLDYFSVDGDTNDLLTYFPALYLYASLIEASIYFQGDERVPLFKTAYEVERDMINEEYEDWLLSGGPLQIMKLGVETP